MEYTVTKEGKRLQSGQSGASMVQAGQEQKNIRRRNKTIRRIQYRSRTGTSTETRTGIRTGTKTGRRTETRTGAKRGTRT